MRTSEFANFKLLDEIEDAPLGELYKAYNHDTKDVVALLLLPEELRDLKEREVESLLADIRATADAKLTHHGLVHVLHVGCRQGRHYVEMEFVKGKPLQRHVENKGPLSPDSASRILRCVAEALNVAHGRGVFHRAVSPSSIILLDDEEAKLGGFGMARLVIGLQKFLGRKADRLISKDAFPNEAYLAPEQREGPGDERADIYGLGASLNFMLTRKALTDSGQLPAPGAAPPIYDLVRRMTMADRRKRIQSCEAVLMALDHLDEVAAAQMPSMSAPPSKPEQKLPAEVGGDPSDTLLWDTNQLETLRSKWVEEKPIPEFQERAHPPKGTSAPVEEEAPGKAGVPSGYQSAFQPLVMDESALPAEAKKSAAERSQQLALARRRAAVQLVFGIAVNLILLGIVLLMVMNLLGKRKQAATPATDEQSGPREYGKPPEKPTLSSPRPSLIPKETGTTEKAPSEETPKTEAFPEPPKAAAAPEKPPAAEEAKPEPKPAGPAETKPEEPKPGKKPGADKSAEPEKEGKQKAAEKDPMKADFMKDEPPSHYSDPDWAKKGKTTVRIVIPGWHKKKDDTSEEEPADSDKTKPNKPKKDSKSEPAPDAPAPEK